MVIVTMVCVVPPPPVDGVEGEVGVLLPPPPPQLTLNRAVAMASAIVPDTRIDYPPEINRTDDRRSKAYASRNRLKLAGFGAVYAFRPYASRKRLRGGFSPAWRRRSSLLRSRCDPARASARRSP